MPDAGSNCERQKVITAVPVPLGSKVESPFGTAMSATWLQNGGELAACGLVRSRSWSMNWPHIQM